MQPERIPDDLKTKTRIQTGLHDDWCIAKRYIREVKKLGRAI
jgi:hypothetical protein